MLVGLIRLGISITGSLAGVLATAVLWKPGVVIGALLVSVITVFVDQTFGEPLLRFAHRAPTNRASRRSSLRVALVVGLAGSLCLGAALTVPKLVEGDPLKATPLFGGQVPLVESDSDGDGIADPDDNCPVVTNPGQEDTNGANRGDACDPDDDNDKVLDADDNCRVVANAGQENADGDSLGDACDEDTVVSDGDSDEDGVPDAIDNCPDVANPDQADTNGVKRGDACDPDDDNDKVLDADDNCRVVANAGQEDADGDSLGDACDEDTVVSDGDGDDDNDGIPDEDEEAEPTGEAR